MVYANQITKEMFLFDKGGEWHDDGVYHEALNMDNTYSETNWYDEFNVQSFWKTNMKKIKKYLLI